MSETDVLDCLKRAAPSGRRRSSGDAAPLRGDHDLNPDLYDPKRPLLAAAVLVPIITHPTGLTVLFTQRTDHLYAHAGQISFPGGRLEPEDDSPADAALRETEEEIGIPRRNVHLIGTLDTYVTRTGFEVTPVIGLIRPPLTLTLDPFEVAKVFEAPLDFFVAPESMQRHSRLFEGRDRHFYAFPFGDYYIWGATAGMLVNLVEVLGIPATDEKA